MCTGDWRLCKYEFKFCLSSNQITSYIHNKIQLLAICTTPPEKYRRWTDSRTDIHTERQSWAPELLEHSTENSSLPIRVDQRPMERSACCYPLPQPLGQAFMESPVVLDDLPKPACTARTGITCPIKNLAFTASAGQTTSPPVS